MERNIKCDTNQYLNYFTDYIMYFVLFISTCLMRVETIVTHLMLILTLTLTNKYFRPELPNKVIKNI